MSKKSTPKIPGGYILKARIIWDKDIARKPPYFREMWDWCLMKASHASYTYSGKRIERGEFLATYEDMKEDLHWLVGYRKEGYKKWQYEKFTRAATTAGMIASTRTTRGLFIKVLNYDLYQDPKNYESGDDSSHERKGDILGMSADIQGINNEVNELQGINKSMSESEFQDFWKMYPRKDSSKKKAKEIFLKLKPELLDKILSGLEKCKKSPQWIEALAKPGGIKYIPYAETWLNQERWAIEPSDFEPKPKIGSPEYYITPKKNDDSSRSLQRYTA